MSRLFNQITLNKKTALVSFLVLLALLFLLYRITPHKPAAPPRTTIAQAMESTAKKDKYSYKLIMKTKVNNQESVYTELEGWRINNDRLRIKGKITESEIEFYQLGKTTYTKDQLSGTWIKIDDNQLNQEEIFAAELNPLANFSYKELMEVNYEGIDEERGNKAWKYRARPIVDESYLDILWKDFEYELWIDLDSGLLSKAILTANSKTSPGDRIFITVLFDYTNNFDIKPPTV